MKKPKWGWLFVFLLFFPREKLGGDGFSWTVQKTPLFSLEISWVILAPVLILCAAGAAVTLRGIAGVFAERNDIRGSAEALVAGDFISRDIKKRVNRLKLQGMGLRFKLASFTMGLVLTLVLMVSAPLYVVMTGNQEETLLRGLWDRSAVLLEGLAANARVFIPKADILELSFLPAQSAAIPEARYVTITGLTAKDGIWAERVWASNDPDILSKIDTAELFPGLSRLTDVLTPGLEALRRDLNNNAQEEAGDITAGINNLVEEETRIAIGMNVISGGEAKISAGRKRLADIQLTLRSLEARLADRLAAVGRQTLSEPFFPVTKLDKSRGDIYIFYKPVLFYYIGEKDYFRGLIRLEVSIESIREEITLGQRGLLEIILLVALAALIIGVIGALTLSTLIIQPIRRLVKHVEKIRDTEDISGLAGVDIQIKSRDEIAVLGNRINEMTHGLVKAAQASRDLSIGKEIQKKFIPLELDRDGNKLTYGRRETKFTEFFGYYEGAKGVSGDYFDYQDLDGRYYAVIKCDVAGKGIPAAFIMIQVATMFLNHFRTWRANDEGMHIESLVYHINDFIETLAFRGRFAAFTLCLFDSHTGLLRFCTAGDNIAHIYDASEGRVKTVSLPESLAAGVLPNFLVQSRGGYRVETLTLDPGDILFLYSDGIEEAKRMFRDEDFQKILCGQGPQDTPHENHSSGQGNEEMGPQRVENIINAVMNKQLYTLHKWHNPEGERDMIFDFSTCAGRVEEVIMALVSVEKMFRCYKDPRADEDNQILVDRKIDNFLKKHFLQYRIYCSHVKEIPEKKTFMYYTHVKEDEQYDDLTLLGIKRK